MVSYERPTTAKLVGEFRDENNNLVDPTDPKVYIYNPDRTVLVNGVTPTKIETGKYVYYWDTSTASVLGKYIVRFEGLIGGRKISDSEYVEIVEVE